MNFRFSAYGFQRLGIIFAIFLILSLLYVGSYLYLIKNYSIPGKGMYVQMSDGSFEKPRLVFVTAKPRASVLIQQFYLPLTKLDQSITGYAPTFFANRFPVAGPRLNTETSKF